MRRVRKVHSRRGDDGLRRRLGRLQPRHGNYRVADLSLVLARRARHVRRANASKREVRAKPTLGRLGDAGRSSLGPGREHDQVLQIATHAEFESDFGGDEERAYQESEEVIGERGLFALEDVTVELDHPTDAEEPKATREPETAGPARYQRAQREGEGKQRRHHCTEAAIERHVLARRLARRLVLSAERYGEWHDRSSRVVDLKQEQLATMLASSRQSVNQALKELEARSYVKLAYGHVEIVDLDGLRRAANETL